ncbi:MAG: type 2 isopentenyl-diphosphate Delta-isomerase [Oligoflexales bacterium]
MGWIDVKPPITFFSNLGEGVMTGLGPNGLQLRWQNQPETENIEISVEVSGYSYQGLYKDGILKLENPPEGLMGSLRKAQHLHICEKKDVESSDRYTGFSDYSLMPYALSGLSKDRLDMTQMFLGRRFALPMLITGMTGGVQQGQDINERLASAAAAFGIPMGVGSQRVAVEDPSLSAVFQVKHRQPHIFLIGNMGLAQILGKDALDKCKRAVDMIQADALAIHLNVIQELVQIEGDTSFVGVLEAIGQICHHLDVPVVVKEVGCGLDLKSAQQLVSVGVQALDVGGRGGTSWGHIEGLRAQSQHVQRLGQTFRDWGIPTAHGIKALSNHITEPLIATGGLRDGFMIAKGVALGADMCGIGLPLMKAAMKSEEAVHEELEFFKASLQIAMMASGCEKLDHLKDRLIENVPNSYSDEGH